MAKHRLPNTDNLNDGVLRRRIQSHQTRIQSIEAAGRRRELRSSEILSRSRARMLIRHYEKELDLRRLRRSTNLVTTSTNEQWEGVEVRKKDNTLMDLVREVHNDSDFRVARAEFHLEIEDELPFGVAVQVDIIAGAMEEIVAIVQGMLDERQKQEGGDDAE